MPPPTHTYIYGGRSDVPQKKEEKLYFLSHSLLVEIMQRDCSVICFLWRLFCVRGRPQGGKQRRPVLILSSSALISCVAGRVSLIRPDSCHSPSPRSVLARDTSPLLLCKHARSLIDRPLEPPTPVQVKAGGVRENSSGV